MRKKLSWVMTIGFFVFCYFFEFLTFWLICVNSTNIPRRWDCAFSLGKNNNLSHYMYILSEMSIEYCIFWNERYECEAQKMSSQSTTNSSNRFRYVFSFRYFFHIEWWLLLLLFFSFFVLIILFCAVGLGIVSFSLKSLAAFIVTYPILFNVNIITILSI